MKRTMKPLEALREFFGDSLENKEVLRMKKVDPKGLHELQDLAALELGVDLVRTTQA